MRIAVVGTGSVATENYLPYLSALPGVTLGIANRSPARAEEAARRFGGQAIGSLAAVRSWRPDLAFVLTAEQAHLEVGSMLIEAHVPRVFFEKPLVAAEGQGSVSEQDFFAAREMLARADEAGTECAVMFNYRRLDIVQRALAIAAEREFGQVVHVETTTHFACWSHCIDLVSVIAGQFETVSALSGGGETADLAVAFTTASGASGTLLGTSRMAWQHPLFELAISYERGRVVLRDLDGQVEVFDSAAQGSEVLAPSRELSRWDRYRASFASSLDDYFASISLGTPLPVGGTDGLRELQVEAGIRRSISGRRAIDLARELPLG